MSRRVARVDSNQESIVDALRALGCSVQSLAEVGNGCPDLLVGFDRINVILEVKDPTKPLADRQLTPKQKQWHSNWKGTAHLVESAQQALDIVAFYRKGRKAA